MTTEHVHTDACVFLTGAICGGVGRRYYARAHRPGAKHYELIGKPTKSLRVAFRRMTEAMFTRSYNRADVLFVDDYYDPAQLYEMVRR